MTNRRRDPRNLPSRRRAFVSDALEARTLLAAVGGLPTELRVWTGVTWVTDQRGRTFEPAAAINGATAPNGWYYAGGIGGAPVSIPADYKFNVGTDPTIFHTGLAGTSITFHAPIANGDYVAYVEFAEPNETAAAGGRVFNVTAEGKLAASGVDPYVLAGNAVRSAAAVAVPVTISDGQIDLSLDATSGTAIVNAIVVEPVTTAVAPNATAASFYASTYTDVQRNALVQSRLLYVGSDLLNLYASEHRNAMPPDLATLVQTEGLSLDALVDPRAATIAPRDVLSTPERAAFARTLNDYVYRYTLKLPTKNSATTIIAYENPTRVSGDLNALYADGHVASVARADLGAQMGFDPALPPASVAPPPSTLPRDPLIVQSRSNLSRIAGDAFQYSNDHASALPTSLGILAVNGYLTDASAYVDPRLGHVAPDTTGWTPEQLGAWVDANADYAWLRPTITRAFNLSAADPLVAERDSDLESGKLADGLAIAFGDGHVDFEDTALARRTLAIVGAADPHEGVLAGHLFWDMNTDGAFEPSETFIAGRIVYLDLNDDGVRDADEPYQATSNATGFQFNDLAYGTYTVRVDADGTWQPTASPTVTLSATTPGADKLFVGIQNTQKEALISGIVYDDDNANGVRDAADGGATYAVVYLDANNNGHRDAGEMTATIDAATGAFTFRTNVPMTGSVALTVRIELPAGAAQIAPAAGAGLNVSASAGQTIAAGAIGVRRVGPTVNAGGAYAVSEGKAITLSGSVAAGGAAIAAYAWDFDYDGKTFTADATGTSPTYAAGDGSSVHTIAFRATDALGKSAIATTTLAIANVAPTATFAGSGTVPLGTATKVTFANVFDPSAADVAAGLKYSFDFNNDGDFTDAGEVLNSSAPTASYTFATAGTRVVHGRVADKDGGFTDYTTSVVVITVPAAPTNVNFDNAYLNEGASQTLFGYATVAAGQSIVSWAYDYNYDGKTFDVDATGKNPTFSAAAIDGHSTFAFPALDGDARRTIAVRVTDNFGQQAIGVRTIRILNVAPIATLGAAAKADGSATVTFSNVTDVSAADRAAGFKYSFDFDGDGDFDDIGDVSNSTSPTATFAFAKSGTYAVRGRIADKDGGYTDYTTNVTVTVPMTTTPVQLTGTPIGTSGSIGGNGFAKAFDGNLATYVDSTTVNGAWAGLDLGSAKTVTSVKFAPRATLARRMTGGYFQGSNAADFGGAVTLGTIATAPADGVLTTLTFAKPGSYRYVRYVAPAGSFGNVAEVQFFGTTSGGTTPPVVTPPVVNPPPTTPTKLSGTAIGTAGSIGGNGFANALDGNLATYVDSTTVNGAWVGLDLGTARVIKQIAYAPRATLARRMVGGYFQGSNAADFSNATTLLTLAVAPADGVLTTVAISVATAFRYVRYVAPSGSFGNVGEVQFFG